VCVCVWCVCVWGVCVCVCVCVCVYVCVCVCGTDENSKNPSFIQHMHLFLHNYLIKNKTGKWV